MAATHSHVASLLLLLAPVSTVHKQGFLFILIYVSLIERKLLYSIMLVCTKHQHESASYLCSLPTEHPSQLPPQTGISLSVN